MAERDMPGVEYRIEISDAVSSESGQICEGGHGGSAKTLRRLPGLIRICLWALSVKALTRGFKLQTFHWQYGQSTAAPWLLVECELEGDYEDIYNERILIAGVDNSDYYY